MVGRKKGPARRGWIASIHAGAASPVTSPIFASRSKYGAARSLAFCFALTSSVLAPLQAAAEPATRAAQLPELPAIPSLEVSRPAPAELEELDARLAKLCSADEAERE